MTKNNYFLLRHGQTIYQTEKTDILYPSPENPPISLTEEGKKQIEKVAEVLKDKKIDLIFASTFFRTKQTAEIVSKELGIEVIFDKRLIDLNLGKFHGGPEKDYQDFFLNRSEKFTKRPPGGENWNDVKERLIDFLEDIEGKYENKNILIVGHGDPLWLLAGLIKGLEKNEDFLEEKYKGIYPDVGELIIP